MTTPAPDAAPDTAPGADNAPGPRLTWLRALVYALVFIAVAGGGLGSLSGKLGDVQENTNASFLSKTAESTRALNASGAFQSEDLTPTVVLYERASGITAADKQRAVEDLTVIRSKKWLAGEPSPPVPS